jgi:hypothetical protein
MRQRETRILEKCKLAIGAVGPLLAGSGPVTVVVSRNGRASGQGLREWAGPKAKSSLGLTPPKGGPAAPPSQFKDLFLGRVKENALIPLTKKKKKRNNKYAHACDCSVGPLLEGRPEPHRGSSTLCLPRQENTQSPWHRICWLWLEFHECSKHCKMYRASKKQAQCRYIAMYRARKNRPQSRYIQCF